MNPWRPPRSARATRARIQRVSCIIAGALLCYVMAYVAFSTAGQYVGLRESVLPDGSVVPAYEWVPGEFFDYQKARWSRPLVAFFYPLVWADNRFWHTAEAATSGKYPVLPRLPGT